MAQQVKNNHVYVISSGSIVHSKKGVKPSPPFDPEIAYFGEIGREEAENHLRGQSVGTFLLRWSSNVDALVLSYKAPTGFTHISQIQLREDQSIDVMTTKGPVWFPSLKAYLTAMRNSKELGNPYKPTATLYSQLPSSSSINNVFSLCT